MLKDRFNSFRYAFKGIADLLKSQANARIHLVATIAVLTAGAFLELTLNEWCLITLCITFVFSAEAVNTAIEYLTDLISPDYHPLAGKAKDVAAAAVLLAAIGATIVGLIIFLPKIWTILNFVLILDT